MRSFFLGKSLTVSDPLSNTKAVLLPDISTVRLDIWARHAISATLLEGGGRFRDEAKPVVGFCTLC